MAAVGARPKIRVGTKNTATSCRSYENPPWNGLQGDVFHAVCTSTLMRHPPGPNGPSPFKGGITSSFVVRPGDGSTLNPVHPARSACVSYLSFAFIGFIRGFIFSAAFASLRLVSPGSRYRKFSTSTRSLSSRSTSVQSSEPPSGESASPR